MGRLFKFSILAFIFWWSRSYAMEEDFGLRQLFNELPYEASREVSQSLQTMPQGASVVQDEPSHDGRAVVGPLDLPGAVIDSDISDEPDMPWKYLHCRICCDSKQNVVMLPCCKGHAICKKCINSLARDQCPFCRGNLNKVTLSQLPEYTAQLLWKIEPGLERVLLVDSIRFVAEQTLSEELAAQAALLRDIETVRRDFRHRKYLLKCSQCGLITYFLMLSSAFIVGIVFLFDCGSCRSGCCHDKGGCGNSSRKFSDCFEVCSSPCGLGFGLFGGFVFLGLLSIVLFPLSLCRSLNSLNENATRVKRQLEQLESHYNREFNNHYRSTAASEDGSAGSSDQADSEFV